MDRLESGLPSASEFDLKVCCVIYEWDRMGGTSLFPYQAGIRYGRWRRDSFEAGDSEADEMRIFFYTWSSSDEKAVDMWSHLLPC